ncbi:MAG: glycosyltransferase family 4 protein [Pseudomonadota bacterium]
MRFEKTVLQVIPALDAGGAERTTVEMTRAIVGAGGQALVATAGGRLCEDVERAGGRIVLMPVGSKNPLVVAANRGRLLRLAREEKVDIIHARSRAPAWSALWAARAAGIPFAATYHGAYNARSPLKRFYNSAMARADLVIANSAFTAASIRRFYDVGDRLRVIPRGADLALFNPEAITAGRVSAVRAHWGLAEGGALTLLLPGRLTEWKGHQVAIEALAILAGRSRNQSETGATGDFQLIFTGDAQGRDDYAASLMRKVDELGLQRMIRWVGHCDDMPAAYAACDIILSPSTRPEAFGRVAVEAGAMARPVIAADHGGARETIIDEETGILVTPGSAEALADAIAKTVALGPSGRRAMSEKARARVVSHFSIEAMCASTLEAYRSLLDRSGAPASAAR